MPKPDTSRPFLCPRCGAIYYPESEAWPEFATPEGLMAVLDPDRLECPQCGLVVTVRQDIYSCRVAGRNMVKFGQPLWPLAGGAQRIVERATERAERKEVQDA